jgi:hypothetical protein
MTHHHDLPHEVKSDLTFEERLIKLLDHWIKHNESHAGTYQEWAEKAASSGLPAVSEQLKEVCSLTQSIDSKFKQVLALMNKK